MSKKSAPLLSPLLHQDTVAPLAEALRPKSLAEVVGQDHVLDANGMIGQMLAAQRLSSLVLWGPPGCGKTTIARLLAQQANVYFEPISAIFSGVADLRRVFDAARERLLEGRKTLLFVDEIHRFNRAQQDSFLPFVEQGVVTLVGATTENPSFELNGALLSRCQVAVLRRLNEAALEQVIARAQSYLSRPLLFTDAARQQLIAMADGDGRYLLNMIEQFTNTDETITPELLAQRLQKRMPLYDKAQEGHYNLISALHKSMRGSDVDAALYWYARMLAGGEDPRYIARRLIRFASEDIGLADPQALVQTLSALEAYERLGSPEGELNIAQAVIFLATAPKSNATYTAFKTAQAAAQQTGSLMPPAHILNAPTKFMKDIGYGKGYAYDHDTVEGFSGQNYFPDGLKRQQFYQPVERGFERDIQKRLDYWARLRSEKSPSG